MDSTSIDRVISDVLDDTGASRVTLRQDVPGDVFPVTHEALGSGVASIMNVATPKMSSQPVVVAVRRGEQVVQNDCLAAFDAPEFREMLELYGGMRAQIVTPIFRNNEVHAILSVHQLGHTREWTAGEIARCTAAANELAVLTNSNSE
jgi:GAF domain-containing protein